MIRKSKTVRGGWGWYGFEKYDKIFAEGSKKLIDAVENIDKAELTIIGNIKGYDRSNKFCERISSLENMKEFIKFLSEGVYEIYPTESLVAPPAILEKVRIELKPLGNIIRSVEVPFPPLIWYSGIKIECYEDDKTVCKKLASFYK